MYNRNALGLIVAVLMISSPAAFSQFTENSNNGFLYTPDRVQLRVSSPDTSSPYSLIVPVDNTGSYAGMLLGRSRFYEAASGNMVFVTTQEFPNDDFYWCNYDNTSENHVMTLKGDTGYLGVGVLNPQYRVDVNGTVQCGQVLIGSGITNPQYLLEVNGTVRCEQVLVVANVGADFVFEPDYNLPSLDAIEAYVKENRHLPNIPSAQVMKENGIAVGDLQIGLLQKVEELTLYMIEMNKENKRLRADIETLKSRSARP